MSQFTFFFRYDMFEILKGYQSLRDVPQIWWCFENNVMNFIWQRHALKTSPPMTSFQNHEQVQTSSNEDEQLGLAVIWVIMIASLWPDLWSSPLLHWLIYDLNDSVLWLQSTVRKIFHRWRIFKIVFIFLMTGCPSWMSEERKRKKLKS